MSSFENVIVYNNGSHVGLACGYRVIFMSVPVVVLCFFSFGLPEFAIGHLLFVIVIRVDLVIFAVSRSFQQCFHLTQVTGITKL